MLKQPSRRSILLMASAGLTTFTGCSASSQNLVGNDPIQQTVVSPSVVVIGVDSAWTTGEPSEQFLIATPSTDGTETPAGASFTLRAGSSSYGSIATKRGQIGDAGGFLWKPFHDASDGSPLVYRLPKPLDADSVTIEGPDGEHQLGDDQLQQLNRSPTVFTVQEFSTPESAVSGDEVELTLTVENTGQHDGTFVGVVNRRGPLIASMAAASVLLEVEAGQSATWTHTATPTIERQTQTTESKTRSHRMTYSLNWYGETITTQTDIQPD